VAEFTEQLVLTEPRRLQESGVFSSFSSRPRRGPFTEGVQAISRILEQELALLVNGSTN
jgi:hypothetical protein